MSRIVVAPLRFTEDVQAMRSFLELLGLRSRIESESGSWVDMVAGAGLVALHSAATSDTGGKPGETRLVFEAEDLPALAGQLNKAGVADVSIFDEAYGRSLSCTDPLGESVVVNGRQDDLYGYRLHDAKPDVRWRVMPVRFTDPMAGYVDFLEALGLAVQGERDDYFTICAGSGDTGQVGVHYVGNDELPLVAGPAAVHLTFETTEPLDQVAARLSRHGLDAAVEREDFGAVLFVTDPDGRPCQVHEPAAS